ncbi:hypothetical protein ACFFNA_39025, partial [Mesorhizobium kowhaii]|uniref:hypothetical protein n=1 Tax=Mesorhizobium kowhaii TaxID=1300272 RepID=UPI0035E9BDF5
HLYGDVFVNGLFCVHSLASFAFRAAAPFTTEAAAAGLSIADVDTEGACAWRDNALAYLYAAGALTQP